MLSNIKTVEGLYVIKKLYRKDVKEWKKHEEDGKLELTKESMRNLEVIISKLESDRKSHKMTIK